MLIDHLINIDEQMRFDLACNCVAMCRDWEEMRDALKRVENFWPDSAGGLYANVEKYGVSLQH